MNKHKLYKITALALAVLLCAAPLCTAAAGARSVITGASPIALPMSQSAAPDKEEVVYGKLAPDGSVRDIYVVNSFSVDSQTVFADYGDYRAVTNLTTTDPLAMQGGRVDIAAQSGVFRYQGDLNTGTALPWDIRIDYTLDGRAITAEELAGRAGHVGIELTVRNRANADPAFTDHYMLQISVTLNGDRCRNIEASGGSVASAGNSKLVTFMKLAPQNGDYAISLDTESFEMEAIQIAGIPFSIDFERPDTGDMLDDITKLQDGIAELADGVDELYDGVDELVDGLYELIDNLDKLEDGIDKLAEGIETYGSKGLELWPGILEALEGLRTLNTLIQDAAVEADFSELLSGSAQIKAELAGLSQGLSQLKQALALADTQFDALGGLSGANAAALQALQQLYEQAALASDTNMQDALFLAINVLTADAALLDGVDSALNGDGSTQNPGLAPSASALSSNYNKFDAELQTLPKEMEDALAGLVKLKTELPKMVAGFEKLTEYLRLYITGVWEIYDGVGEMRSELGPLFDMRDSRDDLDELMDGLTELVDGVDELHDKTATMDTDIEDAIDELLDEYLSDDFEPVSFVSERNAVSSVQFVLMTDAIKVHEETAPPEVIEQPQNAWQRFLALFR